MKSIIFVLLSLCVVSANAAGTVGLKSESTRMVCQNQGINSFSIVFANFADGHSGLYLKIGSEFRGIPAIYQEMAVTQELGYTTTIYESNDYTLSYYSFAANKKSELVKKDGTVKVQCVSTYE